MDHDSQAGDAPSRDNPLRISRDRSVFVMIDMQPRILAAVPHTSHLIWNISRLVRGARLFDIPLGATEQYPDKLGATHPTLAAEISRIAPKRRFSAIESLPLDTWRDDGRFQVIVSGIESHVCVLQTAMDLLAESFHVHIVVDAVASRHEVDHQTALQTLTAAGAMPTTTEAVLFQWCDDSRDGHFKSISKLVRETPPASNPGD